MEAALIKKYEEALSKNPKSPAFVKLGELYRKMGMYDRAMRIYRDGIKYYPTYVMGRLGLAFCYYDLEQFELTYTTLKPMVHSTRDNLRLQKLFAQCCERLGYKAESLETWKYLLFMNPKDEEVATRILSLEAISMSEEKCVAERTFPAPIFDLEQIETSLSTDVDDWIKVDLTSRKEIEKPEPSKPEIKVEELGPLEAKEVVKEEAVEKVDCEAPPDSRPLMSLTLVDLYIDQGYNEKARELLENMLELNPDEEKLQQRLSQIEFRQQEENGHKKLLRLIEEKQDSFKQGGDMPVKKLDNFLREVVRRAKEKLRRA